MQKFLSNKSGRPAKIINFGFGVLLFSSLSFAAGLPPAPDACETLTPLNTCSPQPCYYRHQVVGTDAHFVTRLPNNFALPHDACQAFAGMSSRFLPLTDVQSLFFDEWPLDGGNHIRASLDNAQGIDVPTSSVRVPGWVSLNYNKWEVVASPNCTNPFNGNMVLTGSTLGSYNSSFTVPPDICTTVNSLCGNSTGFNPVPGNYSSCINGCTISSIPQIQLAPGASAWLYPFATSSNCVAEQRTCSNLGTGFVTGTASNVNCSTSVDCIGSWSACSSGSQTYSISQHDQNGGLVCATTQGQTQACGSNGACGSASNSTPVSNPPTSNLCVDGNLPPVNTNLGNAQLNTWGCHGTSHGGASPNDCNGSAAWNTNSCTLGGVSTCKDGLELFNCTCVSGAGGSLGSYTWACPGSSGGVSSPTCQVPKSASVAAVCANSFTETCRVPNPRGGGGGGCNVAAWNQWQDWVTAQLILNGTADPRTIYFTQFRQMSDQYDTVARAGRNFGGSSNRSVAYIFGNMTLNYKSDWLGNETSGGIDPGSFDLTNEGGFTGGVCSSTRRTCPNTNVCAGDSTLCCTNCGQLGNGQWYCQ